MKRQSKTKFNLFLEYRKCLKYISESKRFIFIILGIFLLFVLLGFLFLPPKIIYDEIMKFIQEILKTTENMNVLELIRFIILNNAQSTLFGLFLGVFFGILPITNAIANGYLLGFVSSVSVQQDGLLSLWKLFPHGVFELPAVFISLGLGLKLGTFIFQKNKFDSLKKYFFNSVRIFVLIIVPLLIIAGIIEGILISLVH